MKKPAPEVFSGPSLFSEKEILVIKYIYRQKTNEQIAALMKKSVRTIEGYRDAVYKKSKTTNAVGLVIYALKKGICKL